MKKLICLISVVFFSISICFLDGCNNDDPSAWETTTDALINDSKAWTLVGGMVSMDGSEVTDSFVGFQITFTGTTYSSSNGGDVWPDATNAAWTFKGTDDSDASTIIRSDQVEVQIIVSKGDQLTMTFTVSEPGARTNGLTGYYTFELKSGA
jgi:hypothetical protein